MEAIQYVKSVPRYLATRYLGPYWNRFYTSGFGCLRLARVEPPALPTPRWLRVRPLLSGVCGSDLATLTAQGTPFFSPLTSTPFVLGHEVVGVVEECGKDVKNIREGQKIVLAPPLHCRVREIDPVCTACAEGNEALCINVTRGVISAGIQTGFCRDTGGGWSRSLVAHESQLFLLPERLPSEEAVLIEPFSCCLYAAKKAAASPEDTVLVIGCGTMGLLTIAALRMLGRKCRIIAVARYPHQEQAAGRLGADIIVGGRNTLSELVDHLGAEARQPELGRPTVLGGADATYDCVGSSRTIDDSMRLTRNGGSIFMVGMPAIPSNVDWTSMWFKELRIEGCYTSDHRTFRQATEMVAAAPGKLKGLVGARYSLRELRPALESALHTGRSGVIKTVFDLEK